MLVNGESVSVLSVNDRGLLYGDGVFETIAVSAGHPLCLDEHIARLHEGCRRLGIAQPPERLLKQEALSVCGNTDRAVLKLIVTRGAGARGYRTDDTINPTRIVTLHPWPVYPESYRKQGVSATVCQTRLAQNPSLAGIKHLNRLEQVMARREWQDEYQEGLMLDTDGWVIEGTMSNVFLIKNDTLLTPKLSRAGIDGIVRRRIINLCQTLGIPVIVLDLSIEAVKTAQSIFFCNSLIGIWPVALLDNSKYQIHPLTERLAENLL